MLDRDFIHKIGILFYFITFAAMMVQSFHVNSKVDDYYYNSSQVVGKLKLNNHTRCRDDSGNLRTHLQEWRSNAGCDRNICYEAQDGNYVIRHVCRDTLDSENPDRTNCAFIGNNSFPYPLCCPALVCPDRIMEVTAAPPVCRDRASNFSCIIWKEDGGCADINLYFNFTYIYCQKTCSFC